LQKFIQSDNDICSQFEHNAHTDWWWSPSFSCCCWPQWLACVHLSSKLALYCRLPVRGRQT